MSRDELTAVLLAFTDVQSGDDTESVNLKEVVIDEPGSTHLLISVLK